ncbi:DNRLRE domain-containing protein [Micromonospora sp. M12]
MSNTTWSETGTTWNNQPAIDGATLGTVGAVSGNTWYEIDVTAAVTGNGTYSFGATSTNGDGAYYDTRESGADAPQLVVTTGTTTPPSGDPVFVGAATSPTRAPATAPPPRCSTTSRARSSPPATTSTTAAPRRSSAATTSPPGAAQEPHPPVAGQPRLQHVGRHRLLQLLRYDRRPERSRLLLVRPRQLAHRLAELEHQHVVRLDAGAVAPRRPGRHQQAVHARVLAPPAVHVQLQPRPSTSTRPLYQALYDYNADVAVWGTTTCTSGSRR